MSVPSGNVSGFTQVSGRSLVRRMLASQDRNPHWPLAVVFVGYPVWWLLGLSGVVLMIAAIPMASWLYVRRLSLVVPKGFGIWLAFLVAVVLSFMMLRVRAPYADPEDTGIGGLLTAGYRLSWYLAATVILLYIVNQARRAEFHFSTMTRTVGFIFVWSVLGGVLGLLAPEYEQVGLLARALPRGLAGNPFVAELVNIDLADVVGILGYDEVRPKAPFAYANLWGAVVSISFVLFIHGWLVTGTRGWRIAGALSLIPAAIVTVFSLNRTMWLALGVAAVYGLWQLVRMRPRMLVWVAALAAAATLLFATSGLAGIVTERLANPHSDDRRSQLAATTLESLLSGSPVLGYGGTRDVLGSFASIAGGDTPDCQGCGVPPLGTQGHLWLVLFSQGIVGTIFFLGFVAYRTARHFATKDPTTAFAVGAAIVFIVELPTYDLLGVPLVLLMIALGLAWGRRNRSMPGGIRPPGRGPADGSPAIASPAAEPGTEAARASRFAVRS